MIKVDFKEMVIDNNTCKESIIVIMNEFGNSFSGKENPIINPYDLLSDGKITVECELISKRKTLVHFCIVLNKQTVIKRDFYDKIYPELLLMGFPVTRLYGLDVVFKTSKKHGYDIFKDMVRFIINSYMFENTGIDFNSNIEVDIYNDVF